MQEIVALELKIFKKVSKSISDWQKTSKEFKFKSKQDHPQPPLKVGDDKRNNSILSSPRNLHLPVFEVGTERGYKVPAMQYCPSHRLDTNQDKKTKKKLLINLTILLIAWKRSGKKPNQVSALTLLKADNLSL